MSHCHYQGKRRWVGSQAGQLLRHSEYSSGATVHSTQRKNDMCSISYIYYVIDITACRGQRAHYYIHSLKSDASPLGARYYIHGLEVANSVLGKTKLDFNLIPHIK